MTRPVRLTIDAGGTFICSYQEVHGEMIGAGQEENGDGYIVFKDEESERKIPLNKIKALTTDVKQQGTT